MPSIVCRNARTRCSEMNKWWRFYAARRKARWHRVSAGSPEPPLKVVTSLTSFLLGCRLMLVRISVLAACRRVVRRVESRRAPSLRILPALRIDSGVRRALTPAACACHSGPLSRLLWNSALRRRWRCQLVASDNSNSARRSIRGDTSLTGLTLCRRRSCRKVRELCPSGRAGIDSVRWEHP